MRRHRYALLLAVVTLLVGAAPAAAAGVDEDIDQYVALGDSFAAGPFIPLQRADPLGCFRSTRNYPSMIAEQLGVEEFTDVSCSGAVTEDMTTPQPVFGGPNPPQFQALEPGTDLVTVTIGGNDIGFADIVLTCARLSFTNPFGAPCKQHITADGVDDYAQRIAEVGSEIGAVLEGIHQRSPDATVMLVAYLRILPNRVGCFPVVPIARGDVPYLDGLQEQLTAVLAEQAAKHDALLVNSYAISDGHHVCALPTDKWVEGFVPTRPAFPVHPNAAGMRAVAELALDVLAGAGS